MKKDYYIPEITLIEFTAKDMITSSGIDGNTIDPSNDTPVNAEYLFGN